MVQKQVSTIGSQIGPIPDLIHYIAGDFAPSVSAIWEGGHISEYLLASSTQRHIWHAVLSAPSTALIPGTVTRCWLTRTRRKRLLAEAYGACPPGLVQLMSKLGARAEAQEFYRSAFSALNRRDKLSRTLQHTTKIDPQMVQAVAELPSDTVTTRIASYILRRGASPFEIAEVCWLGRRLEELMGGGLCSKLYRFQEIRC